MSVRKIAHRLFLFLLLSVMALSAGTLFYHFVIVPGRNQQMTEQLKEDYSPKPVPGEASPEAASPTEEPAGKESCPAMVDLTALQEQYPDVKGWLTIPGTGIDYPVLQGSQAEPEYYLRKDYQGTYNINGSLFFLWNCVIPVGKNLIIYGHNMNSGVMFGKLDSFVDEGYREAHPIVLLQMLDGVHEYRIRAVLKADVSMFDFRQAVFSEPDGLQEYLQKATALKVAGDSGKDRNPVQLLTLVTCSYEWNGARTIVIAVRETEE